MEHNPVGSCSIMILKYTHSREMGLLSDRYIQILLLSGRAGLPLTFWSAERRLSTLPHFHNSIHYCSCQHPSKHIELVIY